MNTKTYLTMQQLPGPKGLPLLGNLLQIDLKKLHSLVEAWSVEYGDLYKIRFANKSIVVVSDPVLIQSILRDRPETYRRFSAIEKVGEELGVNGVVAAEGEQWRKQRQITMQAFKPEQLKQFFPVLVMITERLKKRWLNVASTGQAFDIQKDWMRYAVDVTTNFAFGYDINLLQETGGDFQGHLEKLLPVFNRRANAPFPYWHFVKPASERDMENSLDIIKQTINGFITETRNKLNNASDPAIEPANFLEALLASIDENGQGLTEAEVQGNIITILLAGEDTTAHTLAWLVYLITEHPLVQAKMQQEVDAVLGEDSIPQTMADIEQLKYIEAVVHETLRLKSVAPLLFMEPNNDVELGGVHIPKGTFMMLATRYGSLQEQNFQQAHQFKPERWLESNTTFCPHNRGANLPFGAGPRFCPGRYLALIEIKMAMAMLCKNYFIKRVNSQPTLEEVFSFTMMPENMMVNFELR